MSANLDGAELPDKVRLSSASLALSGFGSQRESRRLSRNSLHIPGSASRSGTASLPADAMPPPMETLVQRETSPPPAETPPSFAMPPTPPDMHTGHCRRGSIPGSVHSTLTSIRRGSRGSSNSAPSMSSRLTFWKSDADNDHPVVQELQVIQQKLMDEQQPDTLPWINTNSGNMFFGVLILLSSAIVGVDIELYGDLQTPPLHMTIIESFFLCAFWVEILLRVCANGLLPFLMDRWGPFDVLCTCLGSLDLWLLTPVLGTSSALNGFVVLRTLRLLRLLRLLRVFRTFTGLAKLAMILANSMQAMLWLAILLVIFIYISSVFVFTLLKDHPDRDPELTEATKNILFAMYYHLTLLTGEGYTRVWVNPTWRISSWWIFYWVACVIWLHIFMLNLMVGVLVQQTLGSKKAEEEVLANLAVESEQFHATLETLFASSDINADGILNQKELDALLDGKDLNKILKTFNIKTDVPRNFLFQVFDLAHDNHITFRDFFDACIRLCGSGKDIRSFMLQVDVAKLKADIDNHAAKIRKALPSAAARVTEARSPSSKEGTNLRALLAAAHERMEKLEHQQDAILTALRALNEQPAAA